MKNENISCSWLERFSVTGKSILPNMIYNAIPTKIPITMFIGFAKSVTEFVWNYKNPKQPKNNKARAIILSDITIFYKSVLIKQHCTGIKARHIDQRYRMQSLEINPHIYTQLIFIRGAKNTHQRNKNFSTECTMKIGYLPAEERSQVHTSHQLWKSI